YPARSSQLSPTSVLPRDDNVLTVHMCVLGRDRSVCPAAKANWFIDCESGFLMGRAEPVFLQPDHVFGNIWVDRPAALIGKVVGSRPESFSCRNLAFGVIVDQIVGCYEFSARFQHAVHFAEIMKHILGKHMREHRPERNDVKTIIGKWQYQLVRHDPAKRIIELVEDIQSDENKAGVRRCNVAGAPLYFPIIDIHSDVQTIAGEKLCEWECLAPDAAS